MQTALTGNALRTSNGDIEVSKIKVKGDWELIEITFDLPAESTETKEVKFSCKERPREELVKAWARLVDHVRAIALLNWELVVIGAIAFKESEEGSLMKIIAQNGDEDYKVTATIDYFYPTGELLDEVENLVAEIEDYISGKRAQMSLFETA